MLIEKFTQGLNQKLTVASLLKKLETIYKVMQVQTQIHTNNLQSVFEFNRSKSVLKMASKVKSIIGDKPDMTDLELDKIIIEQLASTEYTKFEINVK